MSFGYWVLKLGGVKGSQKGSEHGSGIFLKSRTVANTLLFWQLRLILRLGEARVSMTNVEGGATEKV